MLYTDRSRLWYYVSEELTEQTYSIVTPILEKACKHLQVKNFTYTLHGDRIYGLIHFNHAICGDTMHYRLGGYFALRPMKCYNNIYTEPFFEYSVLPESFKYYKATRAVRKRLEKKDLYNKILKK